jgi:small-conductance mechanosensitive channel
MEIPQQAFEIVQEIQGNIFPVLAEPVVSDVQPELDSLQDEIEILGELTESLLQESLPYSFYQSLLIKWFRIQDDIKGPEQILKDQSISQAEVATFINYEIERWGKTKREELNNETPDNITQRVVEIISLIDSTNTIMLDSARQVLYWLNEIAQMKLQISDYTARLDVTKQMQLYDLLIVRSDPIWALKADGDSTKVFVINQALYDFGIDDSIEYFSSNKSTFIELGIVFLIMLSILIWLRTKHKTLSEELKLEHASGVFIVQRPIMSAIMLTLLWIIWTIPEMPYFLDKIVSILFLIPFLLIFHGVIQKPLRNSLYYFFLIFLVVNLSPFFYLGAIISRIATLLESFLIAAFLFWFIKNRKQIKPENKAANFWYQFLSFISPVYLILIVAGIIANVIGYENLDKLVSYGILASLLLGLIFGTAYFALKGLILLFTATTLVHISNNIRNNKESFLRSLDRLLWTGTVIAWSYFTLISFELWEPLLKWGRGVWVIGYEFGNIHITIGGIINFFLIILLSWLISMFIRMLLQDEILARFNLPRGIPMAISSLTQYSLVFIGVVLALAYAGFDLQNLGIMAGALGVGIGFGLQNLVGNFISGLILVFERPVTIGDIVKVDNYEGTVVNIGIRSSVIRQWDGSRIIVPNSDLISNKVLNWSMTHFERRFIIRIHTPPDTDPDLVIKLMTEAAAKEELILDDPAPITYFIGIVDQALAFDLFFWVSKDILVAKSNVNLAVQKTLKGAGIKVLLPKKFEIMEAPEKTRSSGAPVIRSKSSNSTTKQTPEKKVK